MSNIWKQIWLMVDGAVIGGLGGLVNHFRKNTAQDWGKMFVTVLTAAFAGMLAQLIAGWLGAEDLRPQFAAAGIAGYCGGGLLDDVANRVRRLINSTNDVIEGLEKVGKTLKGNDAKTENSPKD